MVRTRHNPVEEDAPELISGDGKGSKTVEEPPNEDVHSDESGLAVIPRRETRLQSTFYVEARMTRRPRRANRNSFFYEDSTEDDEKKNKKKTTLDKKTNNVADVADNKEIKTEQEPPSRSQRRRSSIINGEHKKSKKKYAAVPRDSAPLPMKGEMEDENPNERRRSTRQKKTVYPTLNNSFLDKAVVSAKDVYDGDVRDQSLTRKRRRVDLEGPDNEDDDKEEEQEGNERFTDMYSRVKRTRRHVRRDMYGVPIIDTDGETTGAEEDDEEEDEEEEEEEDVRQEGSEKPLRSYFLREHKPRTQKYEAPSIKPVRRQRDVFHRDDTPPRSLSFRHSKMYRSPAHRRKHHRKRTAFHGSSSTSSSSNSGSESTDEEKFQRRKAKSMMKSRNRCLPLNLTKEDMSGLAKDRQKIGASLADIDPMEVDRTITFESVGGLDKHVRALKEMVVFPLLYPEIFERFKINPPRGCIFYGPPGTGKTLVARALANECSHGEKRVAFFMRKGADCLSKWVGESERQLRLLFDQAYQARPSIIFFDEIDGLAPVRSSRQDQIHSSIVSTLLALMDGLDNRGEVVVIGATNRIDSIDPALRRPGRFDREFLFPLPSLSARKQILTIHTKGWSPKLSPEFIAELGEKCVGYCGADMKALCTEATLSALRRRYPQIYKSSQKLQLNVNSINLAAQDFFQAMKTIVPTAERSVASPGRCLSPLLRPLLQRMQNQTLRMLQDTFPSVLAQLSSLDSPGKNGNGSDNELSFDDLYEEDDRDEHSIYEKRGNQQQHRHSNLPPSFMSFTSCSYQQPTTFRPRLMISGSVGQGQTSHLGPAILHHLEQLPVHVLDLPTLYAVSAKTPEESCAHVFIEARRTAPSIIYLPVINQWWDVVSDTVRATFISLIQNLSPSSPLLMLATSETTYSHLHSTLQGLFDMRSQEVIQMSNPNQDERREYFQDIIINQTSKPPASKHSGRRNLEVLPIAPPPKPKTLSESELKKLKQQEESTLRELRIFLRDVLTKLGRDRKFSMFTKPVDLEEVPDYLVIIKKPMDMSTMMTKIDLHEYVTVKAFMSDIDLICRNALEYNPAKDPAGRAIRHRACAFKDTAYAIIKAELNSDFEKQCQEIAEARNRRGQVSKEIPEFYYTAPPVPSRNNPTPAKSNSVPDKERFSRRVRGFQVEKQVPLDLVEKNWQMEKRLSRSPDKNSSEKRRTMSLNRSSRTKDNSAKKVQSETTPRPPKKKVKKCIWASTKRRRRTKSSAAIYDRDSDARSGLDTDYEDEDSDFEKLSDNEDVVTARVDDNKRTTVQDSGLGSSLESNGDSRDSVDHRLNGETHPIEPEKSSRSPSSKKHTYTPNSSHKHQSVTIDKHRLSRLLDTVVSSTNNYNIERLEKLYSIFSQCIYRHRKHYDKIPLIKEMEDKLSGFTKNK